MVQAPDPLLLLPNTFRPFYGAFTRLHPVQVQVILPILAGKDLILQAATGSGKSEAVLAPCLERVITSNRTHGVLYIIPTRALAKDLVRRFEPVIADRLGLTLAVRTGDLKRAGRHRPDILFTTPESLDVMLGSANKGLKRFLSRVGTVIIDEVHQLVHQYRGRHLACLFTRLSRRTRVPVQKIAMSATIARVREVTAFFDFRPGTASIDAGTGRRISARLIYLKNGETEIIALLNDLYHAWHYRKILLFCNSRAACDRLSGILGRSGVFRGVTELHYSNLKPLERKKAEDRFRKNPHALCIATSTLELGIDVGNVDAVLLFQPPGSVSSFLQRIGRANRRERAINFWGICSGDSAGTQVVRFLALLELGRKGKIETPVPKELPSVLSQQVISCLYEKKEISLDALESLFSDPEKRLPVIFESLESKGWLKPCPRPGLVRGGWQYRNHFLARKIWGNFPEAEKEYLLEVSEKPVADIPQSIVSQMDVGDRVQLSGRGLEILKIQEQGDPGKVVARPWAGKDAKDLVWVGLGPRVSFEVAQAMKRILTSGAMPEDSGLMSRTRQLLGREQATYARPVVLANGIEVIPGSNARFRFCTFLGAAANLVLEWAIRDRFQDENLSVTASETGVECSRWVRFETLDLPVEKTAFHAWVASHFQAVRGLVPLSVFWKTLPKSLMVAEITDFLYDRRVAQVFARYRSSRSDIVSGDMAHLAGLHPDEKRADDSPAWEMDACASLLETEKQKMLQQGMPALEPLSFSSPRWQYPCYDFGRRLTATMVSDYIYFSQCRRHFCLKYLGLDHPAQDPDGLMGLARDQGRCHEQALLASLEAQGEVLVSPAPEEPEEPGDPIWAAGLRLLKETVSQLIAGNGPISRQVWISQCGLKTDGLVPQFPGMDAVGIPDLLKLSLPRVDEETGPDRGRHQVVIQVGDIKGSPDPRYHQKWQVAVYAWILEKIITDHGIPARVSHSGFIISPQPGDRSLTAGKTHAFDLTPFLAAVPSLCHTLGRILADRPADADHRLKTRCTACSGFAGCYAQALSREEIQFLPALTKGELMALKEMGCTTLEKTARVLENMTEGGEDGRSDMKSRLSPGQRAKLAGWCHAFLTGRIRVHGKKTHLFPANLSRIFFIHVETERLTGQPWVLGWQLWDPHTRQTLESRVWTMESDVARCRVWKTFAKKLARHWEDSIHSGQGPHIFHLGSQSRRALIQWAGQTSDDSCHFLFQTQPSPWTDIKQVLLRHFYMPVPGAVSFYTLGRVFGYQETLTPPLTLFHRSREPGGEPAAREVAQGLAVMVHIVETAVLCLESGWVREWLVKDRTDRRALPYITFIQEEKRLKDADIRMLQEQPLEERMQRFRSLGFLTFLHARLDHDGRFLHIFKLSPQTLPAKFRQGDFLKLVPLGMADIQGGFPVILAQYDMTAGEVGLVSRSGRLKCRKDLFYSLEEDMEDWNRDKMVHVATALFSDEKHHHVRHLLAGDALQGQPASALGWVEQWLARDDRGLNPAQQQALTLPFQYQTGLIQGPPGTGKTHLLGWIIIALILAAHDAGRPLRIGITALTHQAIDTVLEKVAQLAARHLSESFPGRCVKWGENRSPQTDPSAPGTSGEEKECPGRQQVPAVEYVQDAENLPARPWLILGATGYGFYSLFKSKDHGFPLALDWIIFDEASQVPLPQALLSLIYGRGNFLFLGDEHQLPPIVMGNYDDKENSADEEGRKDGKQGVRFSGSILTHIRNQYPACHRVTLSTTYRMNREICAFPSKTWYGKVLAPAPEVDRARLCLDPVREGYHDSLGDDGWIEQILDPERPVTLVLTDHQGCSQQSDEEADLLAALACRLICGHGVSPDRMAIITPHRTQNNEILKRLSNMISEKGLIPKEMTPDSGLNPKDFLLPLVDTVERVQGAERDLIFFGLTASDPDHLTSEFLNSPNRLNVAMTRARKKLIIVGSKAFFSVIPHTEFLLVKNSCYKQLLSHFRERDAVFSAEYLHHSFGSGRA
ncbi:MAG: DEAD/DEAH box helicase [Desulfotignum sp.]|nr:DEAD/DEAH box helicase [Desulfotignum sp.]